MWKCPGASEDWGNFNWSENETSSVLHWCSPGAKHSAELIQHGVEFVLQLLQQITGLCIQLTVKDGELLHRQTLLLRCLLSHDWSGSVLMGWQGGRQQGQRRGTCLLVASLLSCLTPVLNTNGQLTSYQEPGHLPSLWSRSRSVKSSRSEHNYTSEGNTSHWSKPVSSQCKSVGLRHKLMLRETLNKCWRDVSTEHVLLRLCLSWTCGECGGRGTTPHAGQWHQWARLVYNGGPLFCQHASNCSQRFSLLMHTSSHRRHLQHARASVTEKINHGASGRRV